MQILEDLNLGHVKHLLLMFTRKLERTIVITILTTTLN